jgi:hypothetical protein
MPYLSESVRANFNDIKELQSRTDQIQQALDLMYEQFIKKDSKSGLSKDQTKAESRPNRSSQRQSRMVQIVFGLVISALLVGVGVVFFVWPNAYNHNDKQITPSPTEPSDSMTIPLSTVSSRHATILKEFYRATNGANWTRNDNWLTNAPLKDWFGVTVMSDLTEEVTSLLLPNNNLDGTVPESFAQLHTVVSLDLQANSLMGLLPSFEGWYFLQHVDLSRNYFLGEVPASLMRRGSLQALNLSHNQLYGSLPDEMSLSSCKHLDLSHNMFDGTLPVLAMLYMPVQELLLHYNYFDGEIHALPYNIKTLSLHHNSFRGDLSLTSLDGLKVVRIDHNSFYGGLKISAKQFAQLEEFNIANTNFETIDVENATLSDRASCDASQVPFACPLPDWSLNKCNATCGN